MLLKTAFREIKTSLGRYLAILAIIALGVGFFAGLRVTRTALVNARSAAVDARLARVRAEIDLARLDGRAPFEGAQ